MISLHSRWASSCFAAVRVYLAVLVLAMAQPAVAAPDYAKEIKPLLKARCYACHGALKQKSGLRLDTVALMHKGGESGDILEGPDALILEKVGAADLDERMPPEGAALSAEEIARIKAWIATGATGPSDEKPEPDPRSHWAYQGAKGRGGGDRSGDSAEGARCAAGSAAAGARAEAARGSGAGGLAATRLPRSHGAAADSG